MPEHKHLILLIDDDQDMDEMLEYQLRQEGYEVVIAYDGKQALKTLETYKPSLILLDLNMTGMGGIEFYKSICDQESNPLYPVLILTARANLEDLFCSFHVEGFITKPFDIDNLLKEIKIIIKAQDRYLEQKQENKNIFNEHRSKKILIADSNEESFNDTAVFFLNKGYTVLSAQTGISTIERVVAQMPDIVLINLNLPDIAGDLVAYKLKKMPKTRNINIIVYADKKEVFDIKKSRKNLR